MFAYEFDGKSVINVEDIEAPLPSSEDIWETANLRNFTPRKVTTSAKQCYTFDGPG